MVITVSNILRFSKKIYNNFDTIIPVSNIVIFFLKMVTILTRLKSVQIYVN